jgi:hypothetical protein
VKKSGPILSLVNLQDLQVQSCGSSRPLHLLPPRATFFLPRGAKSSSSFYSSIRVFPAGWALAGWLLFFNNLVIFIARAGLKYLHFANGIFLSSACERESCSPPADLWPTRYIKHFAPLVHNCHLIPFRKDLRF